MAFKFTKDQELAIKAEGTVLVSAAAGSGKTAVLVERIIRRLSDENNRLPADKVLIVTFTNAAANELKAKVETKLKEKMHNSNGSLRKYLSEQCILIENATICTIDSFCISTLRENFGLADISRDFTICEGVDKYLREEKILDELFKDKYNSRDEKFFSLLTQLRFRYDDWKLKKIISFLYAKSETKAEEFEFFNSIRSIKGFDGKNLSRDFFVDYFSVMIEKFINLKTTFDEFYEIAVSDDLFMSKSSVTLKENADYYNNIYTALTEYDWNSLYSLINTKIKFIGGGTAGMTPDLKPFAMSLTNLKKDFFDTAKKYITTNLNEAEYTMSKICPLLDDIYDLVTEYTKRINEYSDTHASYTFSQIEHKTYNLFMSNPVALKSFNENYELILVDEYQDTNDLQHSLFMILSEEKGNIFMVGDVKQSIYGFRDAKPDNFINMTDILPEYTDNSRKSKVLLTKNYRSHSDICDFINYIFSAYMTKGVAGIDYLNNEKLSPEAKYPDITSPRVKLFLCNSNEDDPSEYEAKCIVKYIYDTVGTPIVSADGQLKPAEFSDFTILMRSTSKASKTYLKVFNEYNIPVSIPGEKFNNSYEISVIISILKVLLNRNDDISLLTMMKSPIFAFTDEELAVIKTSVGDKSFYNCVEKYSETDNKTKKIIDFIAKYSDYLITEPLSDVLSRIYAETFILDLFRASDGGELKVANLQLLLESSKGFGYALDKTADDFIRYTESESSSSPAAKVTLAYDCVNLTTFHSSKGLQYPICIIAGIYKNFNTVDITDKVIYTENSGLSFDFYDEESKTMITPINKEYGKMNIQRQMYREELRLLYVAMTRAKEHLVFFYTSKDIEKTLKEYSDFASKIYSGKDTFFINTTDVKRYADWIIPAVLIHSDGVAKRRGDFAEENNISRYPCNISIEDGVAPYEVKKFTKNNSDTIFDLSYIKDILTYKYPYNELNTIPAKTSVSEIIKKDKSTDILLKSRPSFLSKSGLTPSERGIATHKFMECCDFGSAVIDIEAEIEHLYEWEYISKEQADVIDRKGVSAFFLTDAYKDILKADNVYREYKFMTKKKASEINKSIPDDLNSYTLIQGVADCVAEFSDGIVIIDYKTDNATPEELIASYSMQLNLYAEALSEIFAKPILRTYIYSVKNRVSIKC